MIRPTSSETHTPDDDAPDDAALLARIRAAMPEPAPLDGRASERIRLRARAALTRSRPLPPWRRVYRAVEPALVGAVALAALVWVSGSILPYLLGPPR